MSDMEDRARETLEAQGFTAPGPKLIAYLIDAAARRQEELPAGWRFHHFDPDELLADTPELQDRFDESTQNVSDALADVLNNARDYMEDDSDS